MCRVFLIRFRRNDSTRSQKLDHQGTCTDHFRSLIWISMAVMFSQAISVFIGLSLLLCAVTLALRNG